MSKNNIGLVEHVKKALSEKWGYVWGTFGQVLTPTLFQQKLKQYPDGVGKFQTFISRNWLNRRTADCVGLIKSYMWWNKDNPLYTSATDKSADGMYAAAKEKGTLSTIPEIPGICVWKKGHVGIYIGNKQVIEARGTEKGVIQSPLTGPGAAGWTHWYKCPYIEYVLPQPKTELTLQQALSIITTKSKSIMNTPQYWLTNAVSGKVIGSEYVQILLESFAKHIKKTTLTLTLNQSVDILEKAGIISSPQYWIQNVKPGSSIKGEYMAIVIIDFAKLK